jgi:hypothetical protein
MHRYLAIAAILFAAGPAQAAEKILDRTFAVSPGGSLTVEADGGDVRVKAGVTNQVVVHMVFRGSDSLLAKTTLDAVQKDNTVTVTMLRDKHNWFSFSWGDSSSDEVIEVTVPKQFDVKVRTGGGSVELKDTSGTATLRTSGGDVSARNVAGTVDLKTSGGSIQADTIKGDIDADTSGGDVRLQHVDGKIAANTSGGSVHVSLAGANRGITATTSGGDIEVRVPHGTTGTVDASTSGGDIESELPITTTTFKESRIAGTLNGGGELIRAHTSGGSIKLREDK